MSKTTNVDEELASWAFHNLQKYSPEIAEAIEADVRAGATPDDIAVSVFAATQDAQRAARLKLAALQLPWVHYYRRHFTGMAVHLCIQF